MDRLKWVASLVTIDCLALDRNHYNMAHIRPSHVRCPYGLSLCLVAHLLGLCLVFLLLDCVV